MVARKPKADETSVAEVSSPEAGPEQAPNADAPPREPDVVEMVSVDADGKPAQSPGFIHLNAEK